MGQDLRQDLHESSLPSGATGEQEMESGIFPAVVLSKLETYLPLIQRNGNT